MSAADFTPERIAELRAPMDWDWVLAWPVLPDETTWNAMLDAIEELHVLLADAQLRSIAARNPGIDMDDVKARRRNQWDNVTLIMERK